MFCDCVSIFIGQPHYCNLCIETTSNSVKINIVALAFIKLHLSEGISQSVTQSVENSVLIIFNHSNLLKTFQVNLKACLGLTNTALSLSGKSEDSFCVMFFHAPLPNLCGPFYAVQYCITRLKLAGLHFVLVNEVSSDFYLFFIY